MYIVYCTYSHPGLKEPGMYVIKKYEPQNDWTSRTCGYAILAEGRQKMLGEQHLRMDRFETEQRPKKV